MRRKIVAPLIVALALIAGMFVSTPAYASPPSPCTSWSPWFGASETGWGQFRWCSTVNDDNGNIWYRFQVDDTTTDGYQVHIEIASSQSGSCCYPTWVTWLYDDIVYDDSGVTQCFQSAGPVETSAWWGTYTPGSEGYTHVDVKLVRGRICGTGGHQNTASWTKHLVG